MFLVARLNKKNQEQWNKDFETALAEAQKEVASEDTIFLNFRFGMSEKEVINHFNSLLKEKLHINVRRPVCVPINSYMYYFCEYEIHRMTLKKPSNLAFALIINDL